MAAGAEAAPSGAFRDAFFLVEANADQLAELARLIDGGRLRPIVDAVFPLARAREAYAHRAQRGKAVLRVLGLR